MANVTNLIGLAQQYLGTPYKWGGASPQTGFDCSGFVQWLYGQQGVKLPRTTYQQVNSGSPVSKSGLKPGDILFFEPSAQGPGHEGLYIGNGQFIEAPHTGADIRVSSLGGRSDYVTARRVVPPGTPGLNTVATQAVKQLTGKQALIVQAYQDAVKAGIDPQFFLRQINQESGFNPAAKSGAGAIGIAQIVPKYHSDVDPTNPTAALAWAANYMAGLVHKYGGSYAKALSVYNSGRPDAYLDPHFAGGQTYNYVKTVLGGPAIPVPSAGGLPAPLRQDPFLRRIRVRLGLGRSLSAQRPGLLSQAAGGDPLHARERRTLAGTRRPRPRRPGRRAMPPATGVRRVVHPRAVPA